jgi:phosphohistidine phosphatase SixA
MRTSLSAPRLLFLLFLAAVLWSAPGAVAQTLSGAALADALRGGGYVLVMRHANAPAALPDRASAHPDNAKLERQLDDKGRETARAMGDAFNAARIRVGEVLSSPTFRARQTVERAGFGVPIAVPELDEGGAAMESSADGPRSAWLRAKVRERPAAGANRLMVTHAPNLTGAFGREVADAAMGETLVFRPDSGMVARVKIEDWPALAR